MGWVIYYRIFHDDIKDDIGKLLFNSGELIKHKDKELYGTVDSCTPEQLYLFNVHCKDWKNSVEGKNGWTGGLFYTQEFERIKND